MPTEIAPIVSVCMATFNGEKYVAEQLRSILQSPLVDEVLVSDDGSTDRTVAVVEGIGDPRVRVVQGPRRGLIANFESVLRQAAGRFVFLSDQDDIWLPNKVETLLQALETADLVVSDCLVVDDHLEVLRPSYFRFRRPRRGLLNNVLVNSYLGCCMAFDRKVLEHALPFPAHTPMHDWWIGLVAEMIGSVSFVHAPLSMYRRHGANASSASERSKFSLTTRFVWRWRLLQHLASRRLRGPIAADRAAP